MGPTSTVVAQRAVGLVSREVGDELVVYDPATTQTHALNAAAAHVFRVCDGSRTTVEIAESVRGGSMPMSHEAVQLAVADLAAAGLVTMSEGDVTGVTRRRALVRAAAVGAGAVALPVIQSVVAPTVAAAQSGGGGGGGGGEGDPVAPDPPTATFSSRLGSAATISFVQGADGGSPITNYEYSINGGPFIALAPPDTSSPITVPGVAGGDTIVLRAVNGVGQSGPSNTVTVLVEAYELQISRNTAMTFNSGGPYPLDVPSFRLENTSTDPSAKITNFQFTIGNTSKNFDGLIPPSADGNPKPPYSSVGESIVSPDGNIAGGTRSDVIEWTFTSFDQGDFFIFAVDIDNDPSINVTNNDFRTIFQNASVITVTFSTGAVLSQAVGAMTGLGPFVYDQSAP